MRVPGYSSNPREVQLLPERLEAPLRWGRPRRVFVNSMSDVFHPHVPYGFINSIFDVMREGAKERGHVFQVLTKRPGRAVGWWEHNQARYGGEWPDGVWVGTSVENQKYAPRIAVLARLPAAVRFVSAEPLLGAVDLQEWLDAGLVQWVIAGGESGPAARPMDLEWARALRDQSLNAGVPFFLKQLGGRRGKRSGEEATLDGRQWREYPTLVRGQQLAS